MQGAEFDLWLTEERMARSGFAEEILFEGLSDGSWTSEEAMAISLAAIRGFANRSCYFLASAVAAETGWPIAGFWRKADDSSLVHAAVHNAETGDICDILGRRPLTVLRRELISAVGEVRLSVLPSIHEELDESDLRMLTRIARGLPWMPLTGARPSFREWGNLVLSYVGANRAE